MREGEGEEGGKIPKACFSCVGREGGKGLRGEREGGREGGREGEAFQSHIVSSVVCM